MYKSYHVLALIICASSHLFAMNQMVDINAMLRDEGINSAMINAICQASSRAPLAAAVSKNKTVAVAIKLRNNMLEVRCFDTARRPEYSSLMGIYYSGYHSLCPNDEMFTVRSLDFNSENQLVIIGLANNGKELREVYSEKEYAVQD